MQVKCAEVSLAKRPAAVLLDLDNTLYDYDLSHARALVEVREKLGRQAGIPEKRFNELYETARKSVKADLDGLASSHSRLLYFQRLLEITGLRSDVVLALDCEQTYWRTFLSAARLFPDAENFLRTIRSKGIDLAIVTDLTAQIQFRKIVYFGIDTLIDFVVTSEEAGRDKPDPAIFKLAARKLKLAPDHLVWMIGDDAVKDGAGAKASLNALTFLRCAKGAGGNEADVVFDRFDQLLPLAARLPQTESK